MSQADLTEQIEMSVVYISYIETAKKHTSMETLVWIMGAFHEPPDPVMVPELIEKLAAEFDNKKPHPIENAVLVHLKFEGIHPFVDENGRTERLILNLFLMQNGYPPINVKFGDHRWYYDCFDSYYRDGDAAPMVEMIAEYVEERLRWYLNHMA